MSVSFRLRWLLVAIVGLLVTVQARGNAPPFNREVRPILSEYCFSCHGPDTTHNKGGLRLDLREDALRGGKSGQAAIVPGDPDSSAALKRILSADPDERMPPPDAHLTLSPAQIDTLRAWIKDGAPYEPHWAFVPPVKMLPQGENAHPVDRHVNHRLKLEGLVPAPEADPATLVRRVWLDLLGLPPPPEEIERYLANPSPTRWEELVDRLLADPHSAERLALPWLDAARYADSNGFSIDDHRDMWAWRDWVIHAFQQNMGFDQFIVEQIAGDLIPDATQHQIAATGFLRNSMNTHEGGVIAEEYRVVYTADKVDTVASGVLGLTMKCAQCHDHKYDPISQKEYFEFFAFFNTSDEPGMGATNANTKPVMDYTSPLGDGLDLLRARIERLRHLRVHPSDLEVLNGRSVWIASQNTPPPLTAHASLPWESAPLKDTHWIWVGTVSENQTIHLEREFEVPEGMNAASLFVTCDDLATIRINGKPVAEITLWKEPKVVDIRAALGPGKNRIDVQATNNGGVGGFIALVAMQTSQGWTYLPTDTTWQGREGTDPEAPWAKTESLGVHGAKPWGDVKAMVASDVRPNELAGALARPEHERSPEEWEAINTAFIATKAPAAVLFRQMRASISEEIKVLERDVNRGKTTVMVMNHKPSLRKTHVLVRGEYNNHGEEVSPGVPAVLPPLEGADAATRLDLARWLVRPDHPLTPRVAVNRFWQMLFGAGLVASGEDFGNQGAWPTHPELLDWLAVDFVENGWDIRHLLRTLLTSETYRRSAVSSPEHTAADPWNLALARSPRPRLPAEILRDSALAMSGLLSPVIGGPSVHPPQPPGLWRDISHFGHPTVFTAQEQYPDHGAAAYRRSLYTFWKRTSPPPGLALFDAPSRETCTQRRMNTNTPLQALALMNEPVYVEAAAALAGRMIREGGSTSSDRITCGFMLAAGRAPDAHELNILTRALERESARYRADPPAASDLLQAAASTSSPATPEEHAAYTIIASMLLNLDETITRP